ncbi:MAG TPA: ester cyclase [Thermoanaerobaculia bacterium]
MRDELASNARHALERVCSGSGTEPADRYYSPSFVDHVNDRELRGLAGVEESVASYRRVLDTMTITVEQQVVEGDLVTSRFVVVGTIGRRPVRFHGITISRFEEGLIVEDWSVTDTLGMLRQAGLLGALRIVMRSLGRR